MHELSIAQSLVEVALDHLPPHAGRVQALHLQLGPLAGVDSAALQFSYEIVVAATPLEGSQLVIHDVPVRVYCPTCQQEGEVRNMARLRCPTCDRLCPDLRTGKELYLSAIDLCELEETEA